MNENKLIKDENKFEEILALINKMFNSEQRLPEQVFKTSFQKTMIFDFDYAMSHSFWNELEQLATLSSDSSIIMAVLDPDPVSYYYKEFSMYNWCVLRKETTADEYWDIIEKGPEGSPADAILFNSEVIVWLSESMKWGMWAERSYGICILGFNNNELRDYESEASFTMHQAITDLISLNFKRYTVPDEVVLKLIDFYDKN